MHRPVGTSINTVLIEVKASRISRDHLACLEVTIPLKTTLRLGLSTSQLMPTRPYEPIR